MSQRERTDVRSRLPGFLMLGMALCCGCATEPSWDGEIRQWGAMRRVLGEGRTEGRVPLRSFAGAKGTYAVGALAGLRGEVTIVDGQVWVARAVGTESSCRLLGAGDTEATLLVAAQVPRWTMHPVDADVPADEVDAFVRTTAARAGLDVSRPFPFVLKGGLQAVDAHVVNGMCPMRAEPTSEHAPVRIRLESVEGTLVGIHAVGQQGVLTHHGTTTHVHVLVEGDRARMGHVESVGLAAGAKLLLPLVDRTK